MKAEAFLLLMMCSLIQCGSFPIAYAAGTVILYKRHSLRAGLSFFAAGRTAGGDLVSDLFLFVLFDIFSVWAYNAGTHINKEETQMKKILALLLAVMMLLALCACGDKEETSAPAAAGTEGEDSPEARVISSGALEITIDSVTGELAYQVSDNGDGTVRSVVLTWQGVEYTGKIDNSSYTADDPAAQPLFDAYKVVFEAINPMD